MEPCGADARATTTQLGPTRDNYPDRLDWPTIRIAGVCLIAAIMANLDISIVTVAQRTFTVAFHSTQATVAWTVAGYMLGMATATPMTGWAADRFGAKRLFMGAVATFTLGSMLCASAPNIGLLITFRVVQGIGGGVLGPLVLAIVTHQAGPRRLGRLLAVGAIPMLTAPMFGPILGGWLIDAYGWQWIFLINLPAGLLAFGLAAILVPEDPPKPSERFDFIGMLLLLPGIAMLLLGVSAIPGSGTVTDHRVWVPAISGAVLITAFALHAWYRTDHPLIDLRLFTDRVVRLANLALLLYVAGAAGASLLLPSYFQQLLHQTPMRSGLMMVPIGFGAMLTMPLTGAFMDSRGPRKVVLIGLTLIATGTGTFVFGVANEADYLPTLLAGLTVAGMGLGCTGLLLAASVMRVLAPHQIARGSALISVNQQISGSIGAALMSMILTNQFCRSHTISTANNMAVLRENAERHVVPIAPSAVPARAVGPDFLVELQHDLSHAYTLTFAVAAVLGALAYFPAAFLPAKPTTIAPGEVDVPG
ncbi:Multidrug export protein EmrB [Mycobacterium marinum]|uniref:DHA2 family efflux MFS transporter permease subunit n=1 Tax=Mycobacterium marinum TaxID=1781 RepID=UPI000E3E737C|nr:DHA2 family efflux MFS transporter permease subunit [Mycobacterium marinum]RFZ62468.1 Multidrug export protein EmrB [Mycobacterium marinum]